MGNSIPIYYKAEDIAAKLGISKASAYNIIRKLNEDLKNMGYLTIRGKVASAYFDERWYGAASKTE